LALLEISGVTVRFGGLVALSNVSLDVHGGEVAGLIGPNGSGKTTLFNVVCGLQPPATGNVRLAEVDVTYAKPHARARLGLARTFQRLEVFGSLSVEENVQVAAETRRRWPGDRSRPVEVADEAIERVGLGPLRRERVDTLPTGTARQVELARALAIRPRVLLLDEPSSGLDDAEAQALAGLLRELAGSGLAVLLVEHDMPLVMSLCERVHVLDFGALLAVGTPAEIQADPAVRAAYLGTRGAA